MEETFKQTHVERQIKIRKRKRVGMLKKQNHMHEKRLKRMVDGQTDTLTDRTCEAVGKETNETP